MNPSKRYHPVLVTLHWLVALLIFTDLYIGYFYIRPIILSGGGGLRGTDAILKIHMAAGIAILVLIIIRFIIRLATRKPLPADAGSQFLNVLAKVVHYALYFFVFAPILSCAPCPWPPRSTRSQSTKSASRSSIACAWSPPTNRFAKRFPPPKPTTSTASSPWAAGQQLTPPRPPTFIVVIRPNSSITSIRPSARASPSRALSKP